MQKLTAEQSFKAMFFFLDKYYEHKKLDFLGGILGELSILDDGTTADSSAGIQWFKCLEKVLSTSSRNPEKQSITLDEAYHAMYLLIKLFSDQMKQPEDLVILLNDLQEYKKNDAINKGWLSAVDKAIKDTYPLDVKNFRRYS